MSPFETYLMAVAGTGVAVGLVATFLVPAPASGGHLGRLGAGLTGSLLAGGGAWALAGPDYAGGLVAASVGGALAAILVSGRSR